MKNKSLSLIVAIFAVAELFGLIPPVNEKNELNAKETSLVVTDPSFVKSEDNPSEKTNNSELEKQITKDSLTLKTNESKIISPESSQNHKETCTTSSKDSSITSETANENSICYNIPYRPFIKINPKRKPPAVPPPFRPVVKISADLGYFYPWAKIVRDIHSGGIIYKLELDTKIHKDFYLFGVGDYFYKNGKSIPDHDKTNLQLGGISLGLEYVFRLANKFHLFVGLGPKYIFFKTKDHTRYLPEITKRSGFGGMAKVGFDWYFGEKFFVTVFTDYSYMKMHFKDRPNKGSYFSYKVQIGGLSACAGLGLAF